MRNSLVSIFTVLLLCSCACSKPSNQGDPVVNPPITPPVQTTTDVQAWITKGDRTALLQKQTSAINFATAPTSFSTIEVDDSQTFQSMDGFGYTLTGGSASLINALPADQKDALLKELFGSEEQSIGVNYLRLSIGASDLSASVFTYNDLLPGQTDVAQAKFNIAQEMTDLIPVLKKIIAINPTIRIMGSPWTAPPWMKSNNAYKGGSLLPQYYQSYASYFVKYIQAMKAEGITIDAITIQNEPLHAGNMPSMYMEAPDQANFVKNALGPAFQQNNISTKIIIWDHNASEPQYPMAILADADAAKYVDGSAFHLYGGNITALSTVRNAYPTKNIYFTEQWVGGPGNFAEDLKWHMANLIIGAPRNWSKNVLEWNLAADQNYNPHTSDGGCTNCLGALTISPAVTRNVAYYTVGHASKFVKLGSVRIGSNTATFLPNVAYKTPDGKKVLIVMNTGTSDQQFTIRFGDKYASTSLPVGAAGTYVW